MDSKRPYKHILKNLFHEQATELIPLLLPDFEVKQVFSVEMPELKSTEIEGPPSSFDKGLVGLVMPGAELQTVYKTEWIEHSGRFERAYRIKNSETDAPCYMVVDFQTERDDEKLPFRLLGVYARLIRYASQDVARVESDIEEEDDVEEEEVSGEDDVEEEEEDIEEEEQSKGAPLKEEYYVYPFIICQFPSDVPAPVRQMFGEQPILSFNFKAIYLWEKDAREILNAHASAAYFLLPAMKNADADLLALAIKELAQRFQDDAGELGRHLTGLYLMLQQSEMMSDEEKLRTHEHLQRFSGLMRDDPNEE